MGTSLQPVERDQIMACQTCGNQPYHCKQCMNQVLQQIKNEADQLVKKQAILITTQNDLVKQIPPRIVAIENTIKKIIGNIRQVPNVNTITPIRYVTPGSQTQDFDPNTDVEGPTAYPREG